MPESPADLAHLASLPTEARNPRSAHIDDLSTLDMLRLINDEDATVPAAVARELPAIAVAVDRILDRFSRGGRLIYIGAGTSGRLGVLDASECPPTFSVPASLVQGIIAGGDPALRLSSEHSEDLPQEGAHDLAATGFTAEDTLVGIAASGRTPFVLGALQKARDLGGLTVALTCVPNSRMAAVADLAITPVTGPEILTGSTRLKAGTATKLVLNMLSTAVMIRTGTVFGNLMVNLKPTNAKLVDRAHRIIAAATGCSPDRTAHLFREAGDVKTAILMELTGLPFAAATARLKRANGILRQALQS